MTLRIGVIGTGIMGADHVETITAAISGAEIRFPERRRFHRLNASSNRLRLMA
jgi:predicted homoserine dehydrogenase-like protein